MRYFEPMRIALYEPDIPQNAGTILRLAACLGAEAHIIRWTRYRNQPAVSLG
jgi:tRNA (cytidine/uridine-2'-O-)-methyltransferase